MELLALLVVTSSIIQGMSLNVEIDVEYSPPPGFVLGPNEYRAASGPVTVICRAQLAFGTVNYQWSSTCKHCLFQTYQGNSLKRNALHSGDNGTHTCTATDGIGTSGSANIEMIIVGAGIFVFHGETGGSKSLPNNGLVVSLNHHQKLYRFRFFCRSDAMFENVGQLIGPDGTTVSSNAFITIDHTQPGELAAHSTYGHNIALPPSKQGVYTCRIPLQSGAVREINFGLYPNGFNTPPRIVRDIVNLGFLFSTLTCISTGSPATSVIWSRDGQPLSIDRITYHMTQTVINRAASTYENMLTISDQPNKICSNTYTCTITNALGSATSQLQLQTSTGILMWVNGTAATSTTITIQWGAVTCIHQNSMITSYKVRYGPVGSSLRTTETVSGNANTGGTYTLTGLFPFTNYSIEVATVNSIGDIGPFTHPVINTTNAIKSCPKTVTVKAINATAVNVSWSSLELQSTGVNVVYYTIYYTNSENSTIIKFQIPGNTTSGIVMISNIVQDQKHQFQVSCSLKIGGLIFKGPVSEKKNITFKIDTFITVDYTPPPGLVLYVNEYRAASGPVIVKCSVSGATGTVSYQWSSTCRDCPFQSTKSEAIRNSIKRYALHSGDTGTHTCAVNDENGNAGSSSIEMIVVGAGIHVFNGDPSGSFSNNGLIISLNRRQGFRFRIFCRSDSMVENVGELIGLDGRTIATSNTFFNIDRPQPGELTMNNTIDLQNPLSANEQGVYTCRIPLQREEIREINFGLYPSGFNTPPNIPKCLVFIPGSSSSILVCTSTGSPATNVTWIRDGQPLAINGSTYQMTQTVTNRAESTYENVLTINDQLVNILDHTYMSTVTNVLGKASQVLITTPPEVPECSAEAWSATSIKVSWVQPSEQCRVDYFKITWTTADAQPLPCPKLGSNNNRIIESKDLTEIFLRELNAFHAYTVMVTAVNAIGNSTCDLTITTLEAVPSSAPAWINGTTQHATTITIQWGAVPCMNQNSEITHYKVRYGPVGSSQRATDTVGGSASTGGVYTLTGLTPFTNYSIEVAAVNINSDTGPFTYPIFIETLIPAVNVNLRVANSTAVEVSWSSLKLPGRTVSHYTVYYTTVEHGRIVDKFTVEFPAHNTSGIITVWDLTPDLEHQFQVSASLDTARGKVEGLKSKERTIVFDLAVFQLYFGPVTHCITWQPEYAWKLDAQIRGILARAISRLCNCTFRVDFIRSGRFSCRNSTSKATYRSTIITTASHDASQLVNFIQKWLSSRPILEVDWWLLDVDTDCPVNISSFNDPECQESITTCDTTVLTNNPLTLKCAVPN